MNLVLRAALIFIFILPLAQIPLAPAQGIPEITLFQDSSPGELDKDYSGQIEEIFKFYSEQVSEQVSDQGNKGEPLILNFSGGKSFTVNGILGKGGKTLVLSTVNGTALRIPLPLVNGILKNTHSMQRFLVGHGKLAKDPAAKEFLVSVGASQENEFIEVEKLPVVMTLSDFYRKFQNCSLNFSPDCDYCQYRKALVDFFRFIYLTSRFTFIEDLHPENLVWVQQKDGTTRWVVMDLDAKVVDYVKGASELEFEIMGKDLFVFNHPVSYFFNHESKIFNYGSALPDFAKQMRKEYFEYSSNQMLNGSLEEIMGKHGVEMGELAQLCKQQSQQLKNKVKVKKSKTLLGTLISKLFGSRQKKNCK